jgi:hypothetical protein
MDIRNTFTKDYSSFHSQLHETENLLALRVTNLVKKFIALYGTKTFIIILRSDHSTHTDHRHMEISNSITHTILIE